MEKPNAEADAVAGVPLDQAAPEVGSELAAVGEPQPLVEGVVDGHIDGTYHDASVAQLAAAGGEHMSADAYQQAAADYQAYYQQHAEHYQHHHGGGAGDSEEADPNAETGLFIPGAEVNETPQQLTVADVNAMAVHPEGAWTPEEEHELLQVITDEHYRAEKMGAPWAHWSVEGNRFAPVAAYMKRTIRDVRQKVREKLAAEVAAAHTAAAAAVANAQPAEGAAMADAAEGAVASADAVTGLPQHALPVVGHEHPHHLGAPVSAELMAQMGYHMPDHMHTHVTAEQMHQMAAQVQSMTPEQMAAYQQQMGIPLQQFQLAAGQVAYSGADGAAEGLPADTAVGAAAAYPAGMDARQILAHQMAAVAQASFPIPLPVAPPAGPGITTTNNPRNDRHFWKEHEQQELLQLVADQAYRQSVLGITELNWDAIAKHLGRGKRSVQRKYDNLKGSLVHGPPGAAPLPSNDGKKWSAEEVTELLQLVEDEQYRRTRLGLEKVDWRMFGQHFGRSYESVSYKYSYIKNTGRTGQEGKAKHAKAKHETSYKEMAIYALQQLAVKVGVPEGTSGQICGEIILNPIFQPQLDTAIVSGKKTLQRWKHGVRSALNAFPMFTKTGAVRDGEVVWRLDETTLQQEQEAQAAKANRTRVKPLSGAQRRKMRKVTESGGEEPAEGEEAGEEGAHEALAAMMSSQRPPSARLAAKRRPGQHDSDYDGDDDLKERPARKKKAKAVAHAHRDGSGAKPSSIAAGMQAIHGLVLGADGALTMPPEMFAVLPLMMQGANVAAQQAALMASFTPQQQQDYMSTLTSEQREALEEQQRAAEAAGNVRPASAPPPMPATLAAPAADAVVIANGTANMVADDVTGAVAAVGAPMGELQPWLAQMHWPAAAVAAVSSEVEQTQAAVAAAFIAVTDPVDPAAQQQQQQQQAAEGIEPAAVAGVPIGAAPMDAAAIFAAAQAAAEAARQQLVAAGALEPVQGTSAAAGEQQAVLKLESADGQPAGEAVQGQQRDEQGVPSDAQTVVGVPEDEAAAAAAAVRQQEGVATVAAPMEGVAASAPSEAAPVAEQEDEAAAAARTEQQMAELQAYLAASHPHNMEGGEGVAVAGGEHMDPAMTAHFATLEPAQQQALLAQHHHGSYDPHDPHQQHFYDHHHDPHAAAAGPALPFDPAAVFGTAQGHPSHVYDASQYPGEASTQYETAAQYHAAANGEHTQAYAAVDHQHAAEYHQQYYQQEAGEHVAVGDAAQHPHYAATDRQHYAADGQQQYGEQEYTEHGQYTTEQYAEHQQAYTAEQQATYAAEQQAAYSTEHAQAYNTEHGQAAYSAEHEQSYTAQQQAAYAAEQGYTVEQQAAYAAEQQAAYSTEHGEAYTAEQYAAYVEQHGAYHPGSEHQEGDPAAAYVQHDHGAAAAAAYPEVQPGAEHYEQAAYEQQPEEQQAVGAAMGQPAGEVVAAYGGAEVLAEEAVLGSAEPGAGVAPTEPEKGMEEAVVEAQVEDDEGAALVAGMFTDPLAGQEAEVEEQAQHA